VVGKRRVFVKLVIRDLESRTGRRLEGVTAIKILNSSCMKAGVLSVPVTHRGHVLPFNQEDGMLMRAELPIDKSRR
jgi:hypothetical protein